MAQFFSWRFWAAIGGVVALALLLVVVTDDDSPVEDRVEARGENRRIDLARLVAAGESEGFKMVDGYSRGYLNLQIEGQRTMRILPGTPGVVRCAEYDTSKCAVVADLLGDAVVWFAVIPAGPRFTIELPAIVELVDGYAVLENGWEIRYVPILDRRCDVDTESFSEFQERFGKRFVSIVDPGANHLTAVAC